MRGRENELLSHEVKDTLNAGIVASTGCAKRANPSHPAICTTHALQVRRLPSCLHRALRRHAAFPRVYILAMKIKASLRLVRGRTGVCSCLSAGQSRTSRLGAVWLRGHVNKVSNCWRSITNRTSLLSFSRGQEGMVCVNLILHASFLKLQHVWHGHPHWFHNTCVACIIRKCISWPDMLGQLAWWTFLCRFLLYSQPYILRKRQIVSRKMILAARWQLREIQAQNAHETLI